MSAIAEDKQRSSRRIRAVIGCLELELEFIFITASLTCFSSVITISLCGFCTADCISLCQIRGAHRLFSFADMPNSLAACSPGVRAQKSRQPLVLHCLSPHRRRLYRTITLNSSLQLRPKVPQFVELTGLNVRWATSFTAFRDRDSDADHKLNFNKILFTKTRLSNLKSMINFGLGRPACDSTQGDKTVHYDLIRLKRI